MKTARKKKGVRPGIFTAIHTFGRALNWNVHIHLSITTGGITKDGSTWRKLYFAKKVVMPQWRYQVIKLLRSAYQKGELILPEELTTGNSFETLLNDAYQKNWVVHFAKPTKTPKRTIEYLGRYITRPPLAMSRLKHYDGSTVTFEYLDHKTKKHRLKVCDAMDFIARFIQHIPEKGFRMIRHYGFLANRVRSKLLPKVFALLEQKQRTPDKVRYRQLLIESFKLDPLICILCKSVMVFVGVTPGKPKWEIFQHHDQLAQQKIVR